MKIGLLMVATGLQLRTLERTLPQLSLKRTEIGVAIATAFLATITVIHMQFYIFSLFIFGAAGGDDRATPLALNQKHRAYSGEDAK